MLLLLIEVVVEVLAKAIALLFIFAYWRVFFRLVTVDVAVTIAEQLILLFLSLPKSLLYLISLRTVATSILFAVWFALITSPTNFDCRSLAQQIHLKLSMFSS